MTPWPNSITGANAGGLRQSAIQTSSAARVAQFWRWAGPMHLRVRTCRATVQAERFNAKAQRRQDAKMNPTRIGPALRFLCASASLRLGVFSPPSRRTIWIRQPLPAPNPTLETNSDFASLRRSRSAWRWELLLRQDFKDKNCRGKGAPSFFQWAVYPVYFRGNSRKRITRFISTFVIIVRDIRSGV